MFGRALNTSLGNGGLDEIFRAVLKDFSVFTRKQLQLRSYFKTWGTAMGYPLVYLLMYPYIVAFGQVEDFIFNV